ncbi:MAG: type II toxin-antitoxin system prevent-host-death family antitoxin [Hydrogenophaga sp.]
MLTYTSADAQNRFGEVLDKSQREPVQVTRRGRPVAFIVSADDMAIWQGLAQRRAEAALWFDGWQAQSVAQLSPEAQALTDEDVNTLVHELR